MDHSAFVPPSLSSTNKSGGANQDEIEIEFDENYFTPPPPTAQQPASKIQYEKPTSYKKTQAGHTKNPSKHPKESSKTTKKSHTDKAASHSKKK
uniref:Uncharacterized protein n=1 Tax=Acrobeloides nanus TaxID=290746 RepID=A0A914D5X9_9BILA